ncbi:hypothetical protein [Massilia sp. CCM 8734]|uniref:hypothetical protein n=1 Tax=Massilia sp. CCM 8734 TaxID=2609283 RepID=UPI00141ED846|nr:hypothetical protein [Massilia sp. CCM 8734]NHZ99085.1 hypothetical protein [Massilia sp. CCM 8734]
MAYDFRLLPNQSFFTKDIYSKKVKFTFQTGKAINAKRYDTMVYTDYFNLETLDGFCCHLAMDMAIAEGANTIRVTLTNPHLTVRSKSRAKNATKLNVATHGIHRSCHPSSRKEEKIAGTSSTATSSSSSASAVPAQQNSDGHASSSSSASSKPAQPKSDESASSSSSASATPAQPNLYGSSSSSSSSSSSPDLMKEFRKKRALSELVNWGPPNTEAYIEIQTALEGEEGEIAKSLPTVNEGIIMYEYFLTSLKSFLETTIPNVVVHWAPE